MTKQINTAHVTHLGQDTLNNEQSYAHHYYHNYDERLHKCHRS